MRALWLFPLLALPSLSAQTTLYTLVGPTPGAELGRAVALLPDRDGDGHDDLLIGIPGDATAAPRAGAVRIASGMSGLAFGTLYGAAEDDDLGWAVAAVGDADADGVVDFAAGAPSQCGTLNVGYACVYSGADFSLLHQVHGNTPLDRFGTAVSAAGDQDLDGHADFAVGAYSFCAGFKLKGYVRAYSGATGSQRWSAKGDAHWDNFGWAVDALGDHDLDGVPDLLVGAPGNDEAGYDAGRFYVLSGVDGARLYQENGEAGLHYSGFALAGAGDLDLDGVLDYAIGVPGEQDGFGESPHPSEFGKVQLHSGAAHAVLYEKYGPQAFDHLGWSVAAAGDLDQDGHPEVAAAAMRWDVQSTQIVLGPAYVDVLSGATGLVSLHVEGPVTEENHEVDLAAGLDVNGDGTPDLVLGSNGAELTAGFARVLSGRSLELSSPTWMIGGASGSTQELAVDLAPEFEGELYWIFGSLSGTAPGVEIEGLHLPLNPDAYTLFTASPAAGTILTRSVGIVGADKPSALFKPHPEHLAALSGVTINHAVAVFDLSRGGMATCISAPVPVTVAP